MRPVGKRIIAAMEILDREGPSQYSHVAMHMGILDPTNTSTYLRRAVKLGLATVDASGERNIYTSVPDWKNKIHQSAAVRPVRKPKAQKYMVNSVWTLGISATM
jgi:hypothetical protein